MAIKLGKTPYLRKKMGADTKTTKKALIEENKRLQHELEVLRNRQTKSEHSVEKPPNKNTIQTRGLAEYEIMYKTLFEQAPVGVYLYDKDLVIQNCNYRMTKILNSSYDKILGLDMNNLKDKSFIPCMQRVFEDHTSQHESYYEATNTDSKLWLSLSVSPLKDVDGNITEGLAVVEDITVRKNAEEALKDSEEQLRLITDSLPVLISYVDSDLRYQFNNAAYEKWFGVPREEFKGKKIKKFLGEENYYSKEKYINEALSGIQVEYENIVNHKYFGERYVKGLFIPDFDENSTVKGFYVLITDITESKKAEQELLKSQKLESLGVLAGGLAHDFNNLLTAIVGNISLSKMNMDKDDINYKRLTEAENVSYRARDLTQQLLTFSKGGAPVKQLVTSIGEQIKDISNFVVSGSNVKCEFDIEEMLYPVEIDVGQISQVIENLVINAQQSMPEGGIINICLANLTFNENNELRLNPGNYILMVVEDNGIGIQNEHITKIFDPYFTTKQKGSGLGLSTIYSIVKNHGGDIKVESKLGKGTKFLVYLPANDKDSLLIGDDPGKFVNESGRVLIMDDEEIVRNVLGEMLNHLGYTVDYSVDGDDAIEQYQKSKQNQNAYDFIIMDLTIPGAKGGKETISDLLKLDPDVKAIVSSGYSNDPVLSNYKQYGFKGIISKPYKLEDINSAIQEITLNNS